ncbi:hypothetical protein [Mycobacteroides abscessus]|uniref:hypothetical protein n=1 Tax=Mycobacteroides abscessus TaxID=36809 RepID=UPI0018968664
MSEAQKLMAEVAADHTHSIDFDFCYCGAQFISGDGITGNGVQDWSNHLAAEIDKALGGLRREVTLLNEYAAANGEAPQHRSYWVSGWTEVTE